MTALVQLDYSKFTMPELHMSQIKIMQEIRERDLYTHKKFEEVTKQNASFEA